ncbi:MAG TPA: 1-(5-phosphoribosyl)-5-[(5-phosphoribosylamino)methylideneamino]imidazole-4-carboxamide isomerase [Solirubrobacteraceae bacterium]|jgi:phosphoribosylformimino-5-aminoimidazole carboxamide ribotide isomerase
MNLYPAIDILDGNAVRLTRGKFDASKVYAEDPLAAARGWAEGGARYLHVVDLDGAKSGAPVNLHHLRRIAEELETPVQYGGGLRSAGAVSDALAAGAARVILGTAAFKQPGLLERALGEHGPERVLVSVDVRGGHVTTAGWTETSEITTEAVIDSLARRGARRLVFTNVDRDGMLQGPDLEEVRSVAQAAQGGSVIYSGGIGELADLQGLAGLEQSSLEGVIVGKALYERRFTVAQAMEVLGL